MDYFEQIDFKIQNTDSHSEFNNNIINDNLLAEEPILLESNGQYEYDKYDIIDFLELEYFDYLDTIPEKIWIKFKKDVENVFYKLSDEKVIDYVMNKIKPFEISTYVMKNFKKINLEILKKCFKTNFIKIYNKINKEDYIRKNTFVECISIHNLEFNTYYYQNIAEYEKNLTDGDNKNSKNNNVIELKPIVNLRLKKIFEDTYLDNKHVYDTTLPYSLDVLKYYIELFGLTDKFCSFNIIKKQNLFNLLYLKKNININNYNQFIELKNILGITDNEIIKYILISYKKNFIQISIIHKICESGNIDYVLSIINNYKIDDKSYTESNGNLILNMIISSVISGNIDLVYIVHNLFFNKFPHIFTKNFYSNLIYSIVRRTNYREFDNLIFEFINLGGVVSGYSVYTEYIECLTLKKN